jgi:toxin YoeB
MTGMLSFHPQAWDDYLYWQQTDKAVLCRINTLIRDIQRDPFEGIGKLEPLKFNFSGYWSRRIDDEHRVVYKVVDDEVILAQLRGHYD